MVFRKVFRPRLHPVRAYKHIIDASGAVTGGTPATIDIIDTVADPTDTSNQCATASTVHAIYLRVEVVQIIGAAAIDKVYMIVYKNPGANVTAPDVDSVGSSDKKRWVIHQEMTMTGQPGGNPGSSNIARTLFKGVINIPRGYKRNGFDDKLQVVIGHDVGATAQKTNWCLQSIYKEFR